MRKTRIIGIIAIISIAANIVWIILMALMEGNAPVFSAIADRINFIESRTLLYRLSYVNAAFLTLMGIAFWTALSLHARKKNELWSAIALVFVPIYGLLNLICYLSQVLIVPPLLEMYKNPATTETAQLLLNLTLHNWPGSIIESLNGLAYAILGIPSIILPIMCMRKPKILAWGGALMILSGICSIIAFGGSLITTRYLTAVSIIGGILATAAEICIGGYFLFSKPEPAEPPGRIQPEQAEHGQSG